MSEYGVKILNYEAGSLYSHILGVRSNLHSQPAMLTNSLFLDFLKDNGLQVSAKGSTRDVICVNFNYGSRSFDEEIKKLNKILQDIDDRKLTDEKKEEKRAKVKALIEEVTGNKDKFDKKNRDEIRYIFYEQGLDIDYPIYYQSKSKKCVRDDNPRIIGQETIHYKMLYRTTGKAKRGACMFIREELYEKARKFLYMDIDLPEENAPIVEIGAYSSLVTSTIVGKIKILPEQILVIKDVDSFFRTKVISVETDKQRHCHAIPRDDYKLKNTMFDGQALIDASIFPEWGNGYVLLRHHMCKMAAFNSNIQLFFQDYYGDSYETATLADIYGNTRKVKDIKLITTENAMKWMKFPVTCDDWFDHVRANDCQFGVVKTAHKSKYGNVQRMSYQMINALDIDSMAEVLKCTKNYIHSLKSDIKVFVKYLKDNANYSNDFELLYAMYEQDNDMEYADYFIVRWRAIASQYVKHAKRGKIIQDADNLVIVGSPYAMLLASVGEDVEKDDTFNIEEDAIQCFTTRFKDNEYLAEFRNPFNSRNNLGYLHNHYDERFFKYFNFTELIIAVNMLHTVFQDRNNGSDQDSDSIYVTNHSAIVNHARHCYLNYPTIVNNIPMEKNIYDSSLHSFALVDNNLAASRRAIGESSNLAQLCLTYTYNFDDDKYQNYVCILSVVAQAAIDNAKRKYDIDLSSEIKRIKKDMNIDIHGYPTFWGLIKTDFNKDRINPKLVCPMNALQAISQDIPPKRSKIVPLVNFFCRVPLPRKNVKTDIRKSQKVEQWISKYIDKYKEAIIPSNQHELTTELNILLQDDFDELINDIKQLYISRTYAPLFSKLLENAFEMGTHYSPYKNSAESKKIRANRVILTRVLYTLNPEVFLACWTKNLQDKGEHVKQLLNPAKKKAIRPHRALKSRKYGQL